MKYISIIMLLSAALSFISCTELISGAEQKQAAIEFAEGQKLTVNVLPEGETIDIRFTSATAWKAELSTESASQTWVQMIPSSGKGGDSVCKIQFKKNDSGETRTLTLTLTSEEVTKKVLFAQRSTDSDNRDENTDDDRDEDIEEDDENNNGGNDDSGNNDSESNDSENTDNGENNGNGNNGSNDNTEDNTPDSGTVTAQSGKYGWYELPQFTHTESGKYMIDAGNSDLYYAHHLCDGNEKGPGGKKARNYTVCFSAKHHCPVWVAAPRHRMYEGSANRTDAYGKDPSIPSDIQYNSKNTGGGCNKGHMLGSAERTSSSATNKQVFYYSNIAPQYSDTFNTGGGGWNTLEDWVDKQVCSDTLYVVIGAYFEQYTDPRGTSASPKKISFGGRSDVSCPTMYYYILMRTKSGNSKKSLTECSASEIKCAAFVRSHNTPKKTAVSAAEMMSVKDLEKVTGFTYFPNVPHAPKDSFKASDWGL